MTEQEITNGNKLIAEFMGYEIWYKDGQTIVVKTSYNITQPIKGWAKYHTDWNWLMPVLKKFSEIEDISVFWEIQDCECFIWTDDITHQQNYDETFLEDTTLEAVFLAVVSFIKWYNSQTPASKGASR